jgi:FkbM family methyltransferase
MRTFVKAAIKRLSSRAGVTIRGRSAFGIDPHDDIRKLCLAWKRRVDVFFDVGANDGNTAIKALSDFPDATIYSFEPHPETFTRLKARITDPRFKTFPIALGEENNQARLFIYNDSVNNSLVPNAPYVVRYGNEAKTISVSRRTLASFCAEQKIKRISVLKTDTEGYDLIVLRGAAELLKSNAIDFIYAEFNDLQAKPGTFGGSLMDIDSFLRPFGYRFIASYNDYIRTEGEIFAVSNALFAAPPF